MNELAGVIADAPAPQVERRVAKGDEGNSGEADARGHPLQVEAAIAVSTLTDDPLTLTVTDTVTGRSREYHGAPGQPFAIVDRETFASD